MKKLLFIVVILVHLISLTAADGFLNGTGTESDPYQVTTAAELNHLRDFLGNANSAKYFKLRNSLDLTTYLSSGGAGYAEWGAFGWLPIGDASNGFSGKFNGNNFVIGELKIDRADTDFVGLFGYLSNGATIKNLTVNFGTNGVVNGKIHIGGIVGANYGTIDSCIVSGGLTEIGNITGGITGSNYGTLSNSYSTEIFTGTATFVGALVGVNLNIIDNCYTTAMVIGSGVYLGGLAGVNSGSISNSYTTGSVTGGGEMITGGLVGLNDSAAITYSYAAGAITGGVNMVGGLVGKNNEGTITHSHATGQTSGTTKLIGGFVGLNSGGSISSSYATGAVSGTSPVGGFVGKNYGLINNCQAAGNVNAVDSAGGFAGVNHADIDKCYATGNVTGSASYIGGFAGISDAPISKSYSTGAVVGVGSYVGGFAAISYAPISLSYATGATTATGSYSGGLVAVSHATITNCYALGASTAASYSGGLVGESFNAVSYCYSVGAAVSAVPVGGLVAKNHDAVTNSYWNSETSGQATSDGSVNECGKSTTQMKDQATFVGWDFANIWVMNPGIHTGYPSFKPEISVISQNNFPAETKLHNNYPNPFNPATKINFELNGLNFTKLTVYNSKGELVKTLVNGLKPAGKFSVIFNASGLNSGVYFYKLETNGKSIVNKMILLK